MSTLENKGIVILGAGLLQRPLIIAARNRNWFVIAADQNRNAVGAGDASTFLPVSTRDSNQLTESLRGLQGKFHYAATLGTDMTASVAAINEAFSLNGLSVRQAAVTTHKGNMRKFLAKNGLPQPVFLVTKDRDEALDWARSQALPGGFVIKPTHNMGARGVMFLQNPKDLGFAFEYAAAESLEGEIILEEYIHADELSVDVLCYKGKAFITGLADRNIELKNGRHFIETGHTMPTQRHSEKYAAVEDEMQKVCDALGKLENGNYSGALKGDIRVTSNGKIIIGEVATRLSGGFMSTNTYPYSTGNNLIDGYLDILEGRLPEFVKNSRNHSYNNITIERAILADPGIVEKIEIPKNIKSENADLKDVFIHFTPGSAIESLQSNVGKPANVIISAEDLKSAENYSDVLRQNCILDVRLKPLSRTELNIQARKYFNKSYCHVCKVCDGIHCASGVPGMGGTGIMKAFQDNLIALAEFRIASDANSGNDRDYPSLTTTTRFLNHELPIPVLNGPITGSRSNMGGSITEYDHAIEIAAAMRDYGLPAIFGDGADPLKYQVALEAIRQTGTGYLVVKPRADNNDIIRRIIEAQDAGANGWGMDIDAVNLKTMSNKSQATSEKSPADIIEIAAKSRLPFFIKGIMDSQTALKMADTGASALVVSNHGGRIDDNLPGAARVLENIVKNVKSRFPEIQIFADGGIRCGEDIFKMIALGADGVLVGRPVTIAAVAAGKLGVHSVLKTYHQELLETMKKTGVISISEISRNHIIP